MKSIHVLSLATACSMMLLLGCDKKADSPTQETTTECSTVTDNATNITDVRATGAVPSATGGTILDGLYFMTECQNYSTGTLPTRRQAFKVTGSTFEGVQSTDNGAVSRFKYSVTPVAGGAIVFTQSCPTSGSLALAYTATSTSLVIYNGGELNVTTFTKQ